MDELEAHAVYILSELSGKKNDTMIPYQKNTSEVQSIELDKTIKKSLRNKFACSEHKKRHHKCPLDCINRLKNRKI